MEMRPEPKVFRKYPFFFNISPNMTKVMDNHPLKYRKDIKPCKIGNTAYETNEESTSELEICIVLGLFIGMVDGMDGGIICVMTCISDCKHYSKSYI